MLKIPRFSLPLLRWLALFIRRLGRAIGALIRVARAPFGSYNRERGPALRSSSALAGAIVSATFVAWTAAQGNLAIQNVMAKSNSFLVALPLIIGSESDERLSPPADPAPAPPAIVATDTPTSTPSPTPTTSPTPTNSPDCESEVKQNLDGRLISDNTGEVSNSSDHCTYAVGFASYQVFDDHLSHQRLFSSQTAVIGPGQRLTLTIDLPACAYQVDLFYGPLITSFDPGHGQFYGERILASRVVRGSGFCAPGSVTPTATVTPSARPVESPTPTVSPTFEPV